MNLDAAPTRSYPRGDYEEYHPYGSTAWWAGASGLVSQKRYRFTGMERDEETGLQCHGVRYYATWLGRWVSADPIGLGDGVNRYCYCHGGPQAGVDISGLSLFLVAVAYLQSVNTDEQDPTPSSPSPKAGLPGPPSPVLVPVDSRKPALTNAPPPSSPPPTNQELLEAGNERVEKIKGTIMGSLMYSASGGNEVALNLGPLADMAVFGAAVGRSPGRPSFPPAEYERVAGVKRALVPEGQAWNQNVNTAVNTGRGEFESPSPKPPEYFPPDGGALPGSSRAGVLRVGARIDRNGGSDASEFFAPVGTTLEARALPYGSRVQSVRTFEVLKEIPVTISEAAPAYDHSGGGPQYRTAFPLKQLLDERYLVELAPPPPQQQGIHP